MLNLVGIKKMLEDRNLMAVMRRTGISYGTLHNIAKGKDANPSYEILKRLSDYLECEHTKKAEGE